MAGKEERSHLAQSGRSWSNNMQYGPCELLILDKAIAVITGRMDMNQHLIRSVVAIQKENNVVLKNDDGVMPGSILVGRDAGLQVIGRSPGGMFLANSADGLEANIDGNRRAIKPLPRSVPIRGILVI